jgi:hypothetical protein
VEETEDINQEDTEIGDEIELLENDEAPIPVTVPRLNLRQIPTSLPVDHADVDNIDLNEDAGSHTFSESSGGPPIIAVFKNFPVMATVLECCDGTMDTLLDAEDEDMEDTKEQRWTAWIFQVISALAVAQKEYHFVHNDLHSSNVMFKKTLLKYLYFQVDNHYYRIPTFGKITKIIDFARGTFKFGDRWVFSDQFKEDGDAYGQYDYPVDGSLKNCEHKPNPSFDLVRLGTTVIQRLEDLPKVREFVEQITLNDYDNSVCYDEDTFDLYI